MLSIRLSEFGSALPWFNARWTGSVTPAGLAPLVLGQALSFQDKIAVGVTGVVNLCAEFRGPVAAYRRLAIEHLRLPTSDHVEPAAEVLDAAVAFIRKHERAGGRVYVHCCAKIKILRRVRAESSRRPPRHRRDACSMAWRCRFLAARPSQIGRVIAEK